MSITRPFFAAALVIVGVACGGSDAPPAGEAEDIGAAATRAGTRTGGTIEGTLAGEQRSWNVLVNEAARGPVSSSTWRKRATGSRTITMLTVNGFPGSSPTIAGSITITMGTIADPGSCPCDLLLRSVEYWEGRSAMYRAEDARVTLDLFEPVDGDTWRAEGTFSGTLTADGTFEGAEGPRPIEGSFKVEHVAPAVGAN